MGSIRMNKKKSCTCAGQGSLDNSLHQQILSAIIQHQKFSRYSHGANKNCNWNTAKEVVGAIHHTNKIPWKPVGSTPLMSMVSAISKPVSIATLLATCFTNGFNIELGCGFPSEPRDLHRSDVAPCSPSFSARSGSSWVEKRQGILHHSSMALTSSMVDCI